MSKLLSHQSEIEHLKLLIAKLRRMQFGRKSEKLDRHGSVQGCHGLRISDPQASENTAKRTLSTLLLVLPPPVIDFRWMLQGLHYDTILFGFLLQCA